MNLKLNKAQRVSLFVMAIVIISIQLVKFDDEGFDGYGWVFSFLVAVSLIVVSLAKSSPVHPLTRAATPTVTIPSKEKLEVAHSAIREKAEILAIEVEQRANMLADSLFIFPVSESNQRGDKAAEVMNMGIRILCLYLMLGLVGMRRSKGSNLYVTALEFRTLQEKILGKVTQLQVASHRQMPPNKEINTEALTNAQLENVLQVRNAIVQYCIAMESRLSSPESSLLEWFESKCGMVIRENPQIAQALSRDAG